MKYIQHLLRNMVTPAKRTAVPVLAALLLAAGAGLAPAAPFDREIAFNQPDGTEVRVHGKGDEFSALFRTLDGYTVVHDPSTNAYCFATLDASGRLVSTGVQMHQGDPAALGLAKGLTMTAEARKRMVVERYQRWEAAMQTQPRWDALKAARRGETPSGQPAPPPVVGVRVGLTLLVDFSDDPSTVPQAEIINYCNGDNYTGFGNNGSIKSYFYDNSDGKLTYSNVVTIYIRAPQPKTVYNDTTKDAGQQGNLLIKDVIDTMKALPDYNTTILPTFDALTVDGNNQVIACNVFYAGGNGGVWSMGLWPHSWGLYVVGPQELSPGGKKVFRYQITNIGNSLSIGTFCHENGHMLLGYPDLYDYDYDSVGGAGNFCLMGYGGADRNPVQICAYLKYASGWSTITELDANTSLMATLTAPMGANFNHFYRFLKPGVSTEYYIVENRQRQGRDASAPASGIAVWHIDELGDRDNQSLNYNTTHSNYEVTLVQADNQWHFQRNVNAGDANDLYYAGNPSGTYTGGFSDTTIPSARWWDGSVSGINFADIPSNAPAMTFRVGSGDSLLQVLSHEIIDANRNGNIDVNECSDLLVVLTNTSELNVTGIKATASTTTPGVTLGQRTAQYPNMLPGAVATNLTPFKISTSPEFICGTPIDVTLLVQADQTSLTNQFRFPTGVPGSPLRFDNFTVAEIPAGLPEGTNSTLLVTNVPFTITKAVVSAHVTYSSDDRLRLLLIGPDGTTNVLSANNGGMGRDYGLACFPDSARTTFDDDALVGITAGGPPFVGAYRPQEPLSVFIGKSGTNANGVWKLQAVGESPFEAGAIQCWSLLLTPAICIDGGGECPGSDLSIAMLAQPDPVFIGNQLVYNISVTNNGPSAAQNVVVSQVLPSSATYLSSLCSQGGSSHAAGVVTCNLGKLKSGGHASVLVTVLPTAPGVISSSATVTSEQPDPDAQNSTVSVASRVNPPVADLGVGITGTPNTLFVGAGLTYTVSVTNKGPGSASGVTVTNVLPPSVLFLSGQVSQGSFSISSNLVVCSFGGMTNGRVVTATLQVTPLAEGNLVATATALGNQPDPFLPNNTATAQNFVGPAADLSIALRDTPDPVVVGSNFTYTITVTNHGPSTASSVVVNQVMDASLSVVSTASTNGMVTVSGNNVTASLNPLAKGAVAIIEVKVRTSVKKTLVSTATVAGGQSDPQTPNNSSQASTLVADPFVSIVAAGAMLEFESFAPANGALDNGETVTAQLSLRNAGNVATANLVATLLATNGVALTPSNSVQNYDALLPSDFPQSRRFSFTVSGANGATVNVPLRIQNGASTTNVLFAFTLPNVRVFSNTNVITIPDSGVASPYPSSINVSGVTGVVGKVTVTLNGLSHSYPQDVDVLIASPASAAKSLLMSKAGATVANADVTFDDNAASPIPDGSGSIQTGTYRPASYYPEVVLPAPAPQPPYPVSLGAFKSIAPNGNWSLFVADHAEGDYGDVARGWSLALTLLTPVNKVADVRIAGSSSASSIVADESLTIIYAVTNAGPDAAVAVAFTNVVPANVTLIDVVASQGSLTTSGGKVTGNLGALAAGGSATVTLVMVPSAAAAGSLQSTASVLANNTTDINLLNNSATVPVTVVLPEVNLVVSQTATPNPVIRSNNLTLSVGITNAGPGKSLNTWVTNTLPASASLVSHTLAGGSSTVLGNTVVCNLGTLAPSAGALLELHVTPNAAGSITNTASAVTASLETAPADNWSAASIQVNIPAPLIVAAGAELTSEDGAPNGTIDAGEKVTIKFSLRNEGSADAAHVTATLAETGGVTSSISGSQDYGALARGGASVAKSFTFTASPQATSVTATLNVFNNGLPLAPVQFQFQVPRVQSFSNTAAIVIPARGAALPYPSAIEVAGTTGHVSQVGVTLHGINHNFPRDINVLLVNPAGNSVLLMSHVGGGRGLTNVSLTFNDAAGALPANSQISSGTYKPTIHGSPVTMPTPAPAAPYGQALAGLAGSSGNGSWSLYVLDDSNGDAGNIASGWSLVLTTVETVNPVSDLAIDMVTSPETIYLGSSVNHTITVNNRGPAQSHASKVQYQLPPNATLVASFPSQGTVGPVSGRTVTWDVGALDSGISAQLTLRVAPGEALPFVSPVNVSDATVADLNLSNNQAQTATTVLAVGPSTLSVAIVSGVVEVTLQGQPGQIYQIQATSNLTTWQPLTTVQLGSSGVAHYTDGAPVQSARMYRAVRQIQ